MLEGTTGSSIEVIDMIDEVDPGRWVDVLGALSVSKMTASKVDSRFWMRSVRPSGVDNGSWLLEWYEEMEERSLIQESLIDRILMSKM